MMREADEDLKIIVPTHQHQMILENEENIQGSLATNKCDRGN
jgi:hypothetical protein